MQTGDQIQRLRKKQGWSQGELANQLNVSRQTVSKWELGEAVPDTENVCRLCQLFSVSADAFLQIDVAPPVDTNASTAPRPSAKPSPKRGFLIGVALLLVGVLIVGTLVTLSQIIPSRTKVYRQVTEADTRLSSELGEPSGETVPASEPRTEYWYMQTTGFIPFLNTYALHWALAVGLGCMLAGVCLLIRQKRQSMRQKKME